MSNNSVERTTLLSSQMKKAMLKHQTETSPTTAVCEGLPIPKGRGATNSEGLPILKDAEAPMPNGRRSDYDGPDNRNNSHVPPPTMSNYSVNEKHRFFTIEESTKALNGDITHTTTL